LSCFHSFFLTQTRKKNSLECSVDVVVPLVAAVTVVVAAVPVDSEVVAEVTVVAAAAAVVAVAVVAVEVTVVAAEVAVPALRSLWSPTCVTPVSSSARVRLTPCAP
jgi:hypothetical protein